MMTAEQYIRAYLEKQITDNNADIYASINGVSDVMRMYAIGHVQAALHAAYKNAKINSNWGDGQEFIDETFIKYNLNE